MIVFCCVLPASNKARNDDDDDDELMKNCDFSCTSIQLQDTDSYY